MEEVDTENPLVAVGACRMRGLFPIRFVGTPEEEEVWERQLAADSDQSALHRLCEAQGKAFQALALVQGVMGECPDLKPLLAKHHTYLQLTQLIEGLRALTMDARAQLADAPLETR